MKVSIRIRLILAMNALVVAVGAAVGWVGVEVTGSAVEHRLVDAPAANAAGLFETMRLPLSDTMMQRLRQILGAHVLAVPASGPLPAASSLSDDEEHEVVRRLATEPAARSVTLGGTAYLVGRATAARWSDSDDRPDRFALYVLVPERQVKAARGAAAGTIVWVTLASIATATVLALWLSTSITRPLRGLARRMQHLAADAARQDEARLPSLVGQGRALAAERGAGAAAGPAEIAALAASFDDLLGRLEAARGQLARSARLAALGQLAASVAHELRNPLSGIRMNAQVLAEELARSGRSDESLDRILREAERMQGDLDELLGLAAGKADARDAPLNPAALAAVRLEDAAESVLGLLKARCRHARVEAVRDWGPDVPAVRGDEALLRQVVTNLVLNAVDAMPAGGRVVLATRRTAAGGVRFTVADSGAGVRVSDGQDVFDPFVSTKPGGVGLGLYVCRRNVERHGGRIGYTSGAQGTTFWFELPAADPPAGRPVDAVRAPPP
jgi:signal transduction histidine kinase